MDRESRRGQNRLFQRKARSPASAPLSRPHQISGSLAKVRGQAPSPHPAAQIEISFSRPSATSFPMSGPGLRRVSATRQIPLHEVQTPNILPTRVDRQPHARSPAPSPLSCERPARPPWSSSELNTPPSPISARSASDPCFSQPRSFASLPSMSSPRPVYAFIYTEFTHTLRMEPSKTPMFTGRLRHLRVQVHYTRIPPSLRSLRYLRVKIASLAFWRVTRALLSRAPSSRTPSETGSCASN